MKRKNTHSVCAENLAASPEVDDTTSPRFHSARIINVLRDICVLLVDALLLRADMIVMVLSERSRTLLKQYGYYVLYT